MTEQGEQQKLPLALHLALDTFGDPYVAMSLPPAPDGEPYVMTPEVIEGVAQMMMAAAATVRLRAGAFRTLIGQGWDPEEARKFVLEQIG